MAAPPALERSRRAATMKSPKRVAALLLAGFFAFAPPGTMIFLLALAAGLMGRRWAIPAVVLFLCACATLLLCSRRRTSFRAGDSRPPK
jgi:hypothetical protein